jgi:hypothetical protein
LHGTRSSSKIPKCGFSAQGALTQEVAPASLTPEYNRFSDADANTGPSEPTTQSGLGCGGCGGGACNSCDFFRTDFSFDIKDLDTQPEAIKKIFTGRDPNRRGGPFVIKTEKGEVLTGFKRGDMISGFLTTPAEEKKQILDTPTELNQPSLTTLDAGETKDPVPPVSQPEQHIHAPHDHLSMENHPVQNKQTETTINAADMVTKKTDHAVASVTPQEPVHIPSPQKPEEQKNEPAHNTKEDNVVHLPIQASTELNEPISHDDSVPEHDMPIVHAEPSAPVLTQKQKESASSASSIDSSIPQTEFKPPDINPSTPTEVLKEAYELPDVTTEIRQVVQTHTIAKEQLFTFIKQLTKTEASPIPAERQSKDTALTIELKEHTETVIEQFLIAADMQMNEISGTVILTSSEEQKPTDQQEQHYVLTDGSETFIIRLITETDKPPKITASAKALTLLRTRLAKHLKPQTKEQGQEHEIAEPAEEEIYVAPGSDANHIAQQILIQYYVWNIVLFLLLSAHDNIQTFEGRPYVLQQSGR